MSRAVLGLAAKLGAFPDLNVAGSIADTEPWPTISPLKIIYKKYLKIS